MSTNLHLTTTAFTNESRVLRETSALAEVGWFTYVYIVALHQEGLPETEVLDERRGVMRIRLRTRGLSKNIFAQGIKYFEMCWRVIRFSKGRSVSVVNVHSVDLLPLGVLLKSVFRCQLVYDPHELETERVHIGGFRKILARMIERCFIRAVNLLVVVSPGIEDWYRGRYGIQRTVTVLNAPAQRRLAKTNLLRTTLGIPEDSTILLYQGALTRGRGLEALIESFTATRGHAYALVLMGYGPLESTVRDAAARDVRIHFQPAVSPSVLLDYTSSADIGLAMVENVCLSYYLSLPNKLFEYVMAGLPVIACDLPEMVRVVRTNGIGSILAGPGAAALQTALAEIDGMDREALEARLAQTAEEYSWENQKLRMLSAYREFIFGGGSN